MRRKRHRAVHRNAPHDSAEGRFERRGQSIGIIAGKGGVGKTTLTANVGVSLAKDFGVNAIVVDANVLTSNLGLHLGFLREPVSLHDVLQNKLPIEKVIYVHSSGLSVVPSSLSIDKPIDAGAIHRTIDHLTKRYDIVLVDSAPGLSKEALAVINACDNFLVVTNPDVPSVTDAIKAINEVEKRNKRVLGIAVNKIAGRPYELSKENIERATDHSVISEIPYDERVPASIAAKMPIVMFAPKSTASIRFRQLAAWLCDKPFVAPKEFWLDRLIKFIFGG
jgi:septum site-determining protein MinD